LDGKKAKANFSFAFCQAWKRKRNFVDYCKKNIFLFNSYPKENNLKHKANIVYSTKLKAFRSAHKTI
jgi:hypothetical protein